MGRWSYAVRDALRKQGFAVETWFSDRFPRTKASGRLSVLTFPVVLLRHLLANRREYDVVVIHEPSAFWYAVLRRVGRALPPLVLMCHNVETHHLRVMVHYTRLGLARISALTRVRSALFRSWQSIGAIKAADHVLCLSTIDEEYIAGELGVPRHRITRLINGVDPDDLMPYRGSEGRRVLWVGGWLDVKGQYVLPALWRQLRERLPEAHLTMAGTGADMTAVSAAFDPADRASITVLPIVADRDDMRRLYRSADVFLITSLSEGSPLALLEAMAAQLPVVATRVGGIPDVAVDGLHALLFDPARPADGAALVQRLLTDSDAAQRLGGAAQARAASLSWQRTAGSVATALEQAFERRAS